MNVCHRGGGLRVGGGRLVIILSDRRGGRVNLPFLAGDVLLFYVRPIFQPLPPHNYCTVSTTLGFTCTRSLFHC